MVGRPTVILCYHRVNEGVDDPFRLCVSPGHFQAQLELIGRKATFTTLDEVRRPSRQARVVVTFDDGYADNLAEAVPIASRLGVPITVYVTSGLVGDRSGFWWDRLARVATQLVRLFSGYPAEIEMRLGRYCFPVRVGDGRTATEVTDQLRDRLLPCSTAEIDGFLGCLGERCSVETDAPPDARPLGLAELRSLAATDGVTVGAHTADHLRLRGHPFEVQLATVQRSKADLERAIGQSVRHFAYPYGGPDTFDGASVAAVQQAGFDTATTTLPGAVRRDASPLLLRRRLVMDWSPARFRTQMIRWGIL